MLLCMTMALAQSKCFSSSMESHSAWEVYSIRHGCGLW